MAELAEMLMSGLSTGRKGPAAAEWRGQLRGICWLKILCNFSVGLASCGHVPHMYLAL